MGVGMRERLTSGRAVLVLSAFTLALYLAIVLGTAPALSHRAGGLMIFDLMPTGYDDLYARQLLDRLGEVGRHDYLIPEPLIFDL